MAILISLVLGVSMPNFSSLAGLEVAEKFVVVVVGWVGWWNTWLLCLTPMLVALELLCVELSGFELRWGLTIFSTFGSNQEDHEISYLQAYLVTN